MEVAPLAYEFPVDAAIKSFKFRRKLFYGPAFAQLLTRVSHELPDDIDAVLPITDGMHIHPALSEVVERAAGNLMSPAAYHERQRRGLL